MPEQYSPPIIPIITAVQIEGKTLYQVVVEKGAYKPYKVKTSNKFYIRAGSVSVEPTNEELIRLFQNGQQLHFEIGAVPGTSLADVDLFEFKTYCQDFRQLDIEEYELKHLLANLQVLTKDGTLTIAGLLFFGRPIERLLPQAGIQLHYFDGLDVDSEILDTKEMVNTVPHLIQAAEDFVKYHSAKRAYFNAEQTRRTDVADYEPFVIRELVTNAFAHRD